MKNKFTLSALVVFIGINLGVVHSQQLPGSVITYGNGGFSVSISSGGGFSTQSETVYLGAGTYTINGTWDIYSKYVLIDPGAVFAGSGSIIFHNPSDAGGIAGATQIDGNDNINSIDVNIVNDNNNGIHVTNLAFPSELLAIGYVNDPNSTLYLGKDLNLSVVGANIILDSVAQGDLKLTSTATITNASSTQMIVTNNKIISHVVREAGGINFTFPIGIAAGDYTPATIVGGNEYHVSVQDYSQSLPREKASQGMDRTWHIFGGTATSILLNHNIATNGADFVDNDAFITQYAADSTWSLASGSDYTGVGSHTSNTVGVNIPALGTAASSYFSKSSNYITALPIKLLSFDAIKVNRTSLLQWVTASESNNKGFDIERSVDGKTWTKIGFMKSLSENGNSISRLSYQFIDEHPMTGKNFYRLNQHDFDGNNSFSDVRMLTFESLKTLSIYPIPTDDIVYVEGLDGSEKVIVTDIAGKIVIDEVAIPGKHVISLHKWSSDGNFILHIVNQDGSKSSYKLVKK